MICDKCHSIMAEIYYTSSIYFFCGNSDECQEGIEIAVSPEAMRFRESLFTSDNDFDYKEPMGEW